VTKFDKTQCVSYNKKAVQPGRSEGHCYIGG